MSSHSTGDLQTGQYGLKVVLDIGAHLFHLASLSCLFFPPFSYCFFCFDLTSLLKLHSTQCRIPAPVPHSLNSKPPPSSCHADPKQVPKGTDHSTLVWMSPNEDIHKYGHIRAHHLAVPLGWRRSPQISGHGDGCSQPIIPAAPAPALAGTAAPSDAAGCQEHDRAGPFQAEQRAEPFPAHRSQVGSTPQPLFPAGTALIQHPGKGDKPPPLLSVSA